MNTINRRDFLYKGTMAAAALGGLAGCASRDLATPRMAGKGRILRVDAHCHIFNAEDIDGTGYLFQDGKCPQPFPELVKALLAIVRFRAPGKDLETRLLDNMLDRRTERLKKGIHVTEHKALLTQLERDIIDLNGRSRGQQDDFREKREGNPKGTKQDEINAMLSDALGRGKNGPAEVLGELQRVMSDKGTLEEVRKLEGGRFSAVSRPFTWWRMHGAQDWISGFLKSFAVHRVVNAINMMRRYPDMDLFVAAALDVDLWFTYSKTKGNLDNPSETSMVQAEMMGKIAILTEGRILGRTGYDPLRQTYWDRMPESKRWNRGSEPIKALEASCKKWGAVGAKIYPVVGFRPLFNSEKLGPFNPRTNEMYHSVVQAYRSVLGEGLSDDGYEISRDMDAAMRKLFKLCQDEGYSIMAHTNHSHGPGEESQDSTGPYFYAGAAKRYPGVRVNLGHFGGLGDSMVDFEKGTEDDWEKLNEEGWPVEIAQYFGNEREGLYADFSFTNPNPAPKNMAVKNLAYFLSKFPAARKKTMYGSDWHELLTSTQSFGYYRKWTRLFEEDERFKDYAEGVLGQNAADYLGLRKGQKVRRNLDTFFDSWKVRPEWMKMV